MHDKQVTIRMSEMMHNELKKRAKEQLHSVSGLIRIILMKELRDNSYNKDTKSI